MQLAVEKDTSYVENSEHFVLSIQHLEETYTLADQVIIIIKFNRDSKAENLLFEYKLICSHE